MQGLLPLVTAKDKRCGGSSAADGQKVPKSVMAADRFPGRPRAREDRRTGPAAPRLGGTTDTGYLLKPPSNPTGATRVAISPVPRSKEATSARPASAPHRPNHAMTVANIFIGFRCAGSVRLIQSPLVLSMSPPELLRRSPVPLRFPFSGCAYRIKWREPLQAPCAACRHPRQPVCRVSSMDSIRCWARRSTSAALCSPWASAWNS